MNLKKDPHKSAVVLVFLALLVLIGISAWQYSKTDNWSVYRNERYNFEFKYPSANYNLSQSNLSDSTFKVFIRSISYPEPTVRGFTVMENQSVDRTLQSLEGNVVDRGQVSIDGRKGVRVVTKAEDGPVRGPAKDTEIFVEEYGNVYKLHRVPDGILSTFRFLG